MVRSYQRFEHSVQFGVINSSNVVYSPKTASSPAIAITGALEAINLWNIKTGEIVQKLSDGVDVGSSASKTLTAPPSVTYLQYHKDTTIIAAGYSDGSIKIWDSASGSVLIVFTGHKTAITHLVFDRTGTVLCSGSKDTTIILWDLVGEVGLFKLKGHKDQITGLGFIPSNKGSEDETEDWLVSTSKDGLIKLWDLKAKACVETHVAHSGECWSFDYDPRSNVLVTAGMENQLKVWYVDINKSIMSGEMLREQGIYLKQSTARASSIEFKVVGETCFFLCQNSDKTIELFRMRTLEEIEKAISRKIKKLEKDGLSKEEVSQQIEAGKISMLVHPITIIRCLSKTSSCTWGTCSSKSLQVLVGLNSNCMEYYEVKLPAQVKKISITTGEVQPSKKYIVDLFGHRNDVRCIDISHDDKLLASASNGQLKIWNIRTRNCLRTLECGYAMCCKFLPGDALVIVGTRHGELQLFDLASSEMIFDTTAHNEAVWSLDITEDGKTLVTGSDDKTVKFWQFRVESEHTPGTNLEVPKMKLVHSKTLEMTEDVLCVKISADAKYLAVSLLDNTVKVFYFDTLKFFISLYGHKLPVLSLDISFDSKILVTTSADKNIKIWGLDFGDCHKSIFAHQDAIMNVKFLPESHNFFSTSKDGMVKYWDGSKFECIQKLAAHYSEVWALAVSYSGEFVITASHDHSVRIWEQSSDQVFIEEEKEKEIEELYEQTLLESLENDDIAPRQQEDDQVENVNNQTTESLKDGEKIMEALDLGTKDLEATEEYDKQLKNHKANGGLAPVKPERHILLTAKNMTAYEYVYDVVKGVKAAHLEDAIMILPFSYSVKLLVFLNYWIDNKTYLVKSLTLICRILFFIIAIHHKELVSSKNPIIKTHLIDVKDKLRKEMAEITDNLGFNTEGLRFLSDQWKLKHSKEFVDESEVEEVEKKFGVKRAFETLA